MEVLGAKQGDSVHFIGIGGISMSSLAMILHEKGFKVSGSDITRTSLTEKMENMGISIRYHQGEDNIANPNLVVYTAAVSADNPEYLAARKKNIPLVERAVFLGEIMKVYARSVAIAGTHGKTTTTSMLSVVMHHALLDPTALIGGEVNELGGNLLIGNSEIFITEACEYVESFLKFHPKIGVILNVEEDHLDYFENLEHIISAFSKFSDRIPQDGYLVINGMDNNAMKASKNAKCEVVTFGIGSGYDFSATDIRYDKLGNGSFTIISANQCLGDISLNVPGEHNIQNALAAFCVAYKENVPLSKIIEGLSLFSGANRRFEYKGEYNQAVIIDDYAHHPTEITAALKAAKKLGKKEIWAVFQSHTYTRTAAFLKEFSVSFQDADHIIVTDIFAAREKDTGIVKPQDLVELLLNNKKDAVYISGYENIADYLRKRVGENHLVMTIGAGPVNKVAEILSKQSSKDKGFSQGA